MFPMDRSPVPGRDPLFMESISKTMRVPDRLSVGPGQEQEQSQTEAPPVYSMQVPERLTYAEAADLSPRPQFGPKTKVPALEVCLESPLEAPHRDAQQSPIRRSMSDQSFARTPPGTPSQNRALVLPRQQQHSSENWSAEDEGGAAVELIVLRRQVLKMSRRLAALERHNSERRNTEFVLFCLLGSACLLNAWLWIRR
ncbi:hypothetical protein WMY93_007623 [Mugilogobius chulae]|uniref:Mitochondrial fission factor n=1 Tax=Mugilogobius chulae TaxID=88201 RepID=A0AAW0PGW3_9GOBI